MAPMTEFEAFPHVVHADLGRTNCEGTIRIEEREAYVCLVCDGCGFMFGALDPAIAAALFRRRRAERANGGQPPAR